MPTSDKPPRAKLLRKPRAPPPPQSPPPRPASPAKSLISVVTTLSNSPFYCNYSHASSPSLHTGVVSPPPPSEFNPRSLPSRTTLNSVIHKNDLKYVLDPQIRENSQLGTYIEGRTLLKPYKPRGPDGLPVRPPRTHPAIVHLSLDEGEPYPQRAPPAFTLQDFIIKLSEVHHLPIASVKRIMYSKHNYRRIQEIISQQLIASDKKLHTQEMIPSEDMPIVEPRIPQQQLLVEIVALIKSQMADNSGVTVKSVIRKIPKYSPGYLKESSSQVHAEILLYENSSDPDVNRLIDLRRHTEVTCLNNVYHASHGKYFQGSRRSHSPFVYPENELITVAELAILDSLMTGGSVLSLKANFVSQLPDIGKMRNTLTYINLSFNDFQFMPPEIFGIRQLKVLKMRNNPLCEIPEEIGHLTCLRVLVFSFCLVSDLPLSLFTLTELRHLDVSYNRLTSLPNEIKQLESLKELNIEGNQLAALPCGSLCLNLNYLRVRNNFMHPLLWTENSRNEPQRLIHLAAHQVHANELVPDLSQVPLKIAQILESFTKCETCSGIMFGPGLRSIRPVTFLFGVKNLPFYFRSCSTECLKIFQTSTESLSDLLHR